MSWPQTANYYRRIEMTDPVHRIKDLLFWALGESAKTEMTRTVSDNEPNRMDKKLATSLFRLHFIPERNKFHSTAVLIGLTREQAGNGPSRLHI